ncbi:MAG: hypothetical protein ACM31D_16720 [Bacteroidota bacterium]
MSDKDNLIPLFDSQEFRAALDASAEDVRAGRVGDLRPQLAGLRLRLAELEARLEERAAAAGPGL